MFDKFSAFFVYFGVVVLMCAVLVFAVVDKADTVVMNDKEELDSWSVVINGAVRVEGAEGGRSYTLSLGQGFGIKPA